MGHYVHALLLQECPLYTRPINITSLITLGLPVGSGLRLRNLVGLIINNASSYIAHFTDVSMRCTISGGLVRAAYFGAIGIAAYHIEGC